MTDSINPALSIIQGIVSATQPGGANSTGSSTTSGNSTSSATGSTTSSLSSLISPTVLSLLQGTNTSTSDLLGGTDTSSTSGGLLSTLLGNNDTISSTDPLAGVYNALGSNASIVAAAVNDAQQQQTEAQTQNNPVEAVLSDYNNATNAYNQTLLQNAQAVAAANDYGPDGTPLVA